MGKRQFCFILLLLLFFIFTIGENPLLANPANRVTIMSNGKNFVSNQAPYVENGTIMVPLRSLAEEFGFSVDYDTKLKQVTLTKGSAMDGFRFDVSCGDYFGLNQFQNVDGKEYSGGVFVKYNFLPTYKSGSIFVPIQTAAQIVGIGLNWDSTKETVTLLPLEDTARQYYQAVKKY